MLFFILALQIFLSIWTANCIQLYPLCGGNLLAYKWNPQTSQQESIGPNVCVSKMVELINLNDGKTADRPRGGDVPDVRGDMAEGKNGDDNVINLDSQSSMSITCKKSENFCACEYKNTTGDILNITKVVYECCHGYAQDYGQPGCPKKLELKSLLQTLKDKNFAKLYEAIQEVGLGDELNNGNYTIFAPTDEIFIKETTSLPDIVNNDLPGANTPDDNTELRLKALKKLILSHVVPGIVKSSKFQSKAPLTTLATDPNPLKIKMDSSYGIWTANCVPLIDSEIEAENGVIHPVQGFIPPARESLYDILQQQPQFSRMLKLLKSAGLFDALKSSKDSHTVLALTNDAFDKMDPSLLDKLEAGDKCSLRIIKHHVIPKTVCSKYIEKEGDQKLMADDLLPAFLGINLNSLLEYSNEYMLGDNATLLQKDIPALNGMVHVVDKLVVPPEAKSLMERLKDEKEASQFLRLLTQNSDVIKDLKEGSIIYVPKDSAFKELDENTQKKLESDKEYQINFLRNHIFNSNDLERGDRMTYYKSVKSLSGDSLTASYNPLDKTPFSVQCSRVASYEKESCESKYFLTNKVIKPTLRSSDVEWMQGLKDVAEISKFVELLALNDYKLNLNRTYTIYAPSNDILTQEKLEALKSNPKETSVTRQLTRWNRDENVMEFIDRHIKEGYECCSNICKRITVLPSWNPFSVFSGIFSSKIFDFPTFGTSISRGYDLKRRGAEPSKKEYQCQDIPLTPKIILHILNSNDV